MATKKKVESAEAVEVKEVAEEKVESKAITTKSVVAESKTISSSQMDDDIRKIVDFYGITSEDIAKGNVDNMGLKADELSAIKERYNALV